MKWKQYVTAVLFLLGLAAGMAGLAAANLNGGGQVRAMLSALPEGRWAKVQAVLSNSEGAVSGDLDSSHGFIQLYGLFQRLTGRRVLNDMDPSLTVVKLSNGQLQFVDLTEEGPLDVSGNSASTVRFRDALAELGIPLLYAQAPQKVGGGRELMPYGVEEYGNAYADAFLEQIGAAGVDALDLRPAFGAGEDFSRYFFNTDHHWKPEGAFLAWQQIAQRLRELGWEVDETYTNSDSFEKITYEDYFLGSQGKRTGTLYAGVDDIDLWKPKFETDFAYTAPAAGVDRSGPFEESLLFPERVAEKDYFNGNPYTLYAGGDYLYSHITNRNNPDGPKVLLIRESFACALTPFLALGCSELSTVDLRYFDGDLMELTAQESPDLVLIMYGASTTRLPALFSFFD